MKLTPKHHGFQKDFFQQCSMDSKATKAKLASFDKAVKEWDPQADLKNRIARHHQWIARQKKQGKLWGRLVPNPLT